MNQTTYKQKRAKSGVAQRRAIGQAGQSAIVAVIVLFILLFVAGIFIALVAGNINNTKRAATTSAAGRFAEAGIKYLDEQLTNSPEGADWRPVPECAFGAAACSNPNISIQDPDYRWVRPCTDTNADGVNDDEPCGYTRVPFGSDVGGASDRGPSVGGRALVRVTYRPMPPALPNQPSTLPVDPLSRYIKIESVGRVGQINPQDPTTYNNSEALGLRVELVAYKAINLNEYVLQVLNKDNKADTVGLGVIAPVMDRPPVNAASPARVRRDIETVFRGPIRVNAGLTFYGIHRIILDPRYNQSLEVAGPIHLNGISDTATAFTVNDPTQVYIYVDQGGVPQPVNKVGQPVSVLPSGSASFSTLANEYSTLTNGIGFPLVRDNPSGNETDRLPVEVDAQGNTYQQQRSVGRQSPPLMDAITGPNNTTRYLALTRDAPPLPPLFASTNQVSPALGTRAGLYGWGQGMYIANTADVQNGSENLFGGYSLRGDWMNPPQNAVGNPADKSRWRGDFEYVPEGVIITLYPGYFTAEVSAHDGANGSRRQFFFRKPDTPNDGGRLTSIRKILRFTRVQNPPANSYGPDNKPVGVGTNVVQTEAKFEGYPADRLGFDRLPNTPDDTPYYEGEFVIYAEGNIRIRGTVGGRDPETSEYFKRHLTVVSNSNIYIDGNLLRDNITANNTDQRALAVKGQSTIALLAKNYVVVNTTQFHTPQQELFESETLAEDVPFARIVRNKPGQQSRFDFRTTFGPTRLNTAVGQGFVDPFTDYTITPSLFVRHASSSRAAGGVTNINLFVNETPDGVPDTPVGALLPNRIDFAAFGYAQDTFTMGLTGPSGAAGNQEPVFLYNRFDIPPTYLYPTNNPLGNDAAGLPYPATPPTIGTDNIMALNVDSSFSLPQTTSDYLLTRVGVAPMDIRIEALIYAQEGSFFIIPGPWFNPNQNDTYENFLSADPERGGRRAGEDLTTAGRQRVNERYPFYKEPMDIRITFCGSINENLPAEIADQGAWMEKWGWVPRYYGATGLPNAAGYPGMGDAIQTVHGPEGTLAKQDGTLPGNGGNGIIFEYDQRALSPYAPQYSGAFNAIGRPLRRNSYNPNEPLPFAPRLPVAPGLLYYGQNTITDTNIVQPPIIIP